MSYINHTDWLNNLYESYNNKILPNLIDRTDNNTNLELEYTEPILYRSTLDIDFVIDATGSYLKKEELVNHIKSGAKRVIVSRTPSDMFDLIPGATNFPLFTFMICSFFKSLFNILIMSFLPFESFTPKEKAIFL